MKRPRICTLLHRFTRTSATLVLLVGLASPALAQDDPPADRTLSGSANFDLGRHIGGVVSLGTLTITSDDLGMDPAHSIEVSENGYAFLSNDILIRNGSGGSLVFDGSNQSHDFDVFYFGSGDYNENVTLPGNNSYINGSDDSVTAFGGNWFWQSEYTRLNGQRQTFSIDDEQFRVSPTSRRISPVTLELSDNPSEILSSYNRTNSAQQVPNEVSGGNFDWTQSETESPTLERRNTLFQTGPAAEGDPQPVLDLSGISIAAQGTALRNRFLEETRSNLGRFVLGTAPNSFQANDTVTISTFGDDNENTRLTLGAFNESDSGVTATLSSDTLFDSDNSEATVDVTADFAIDANETGTFRKTINVGSFITGEGIAGETIQSDLDVGFEYAVVENNVALAEDITVFKFEDENSAGLLARNETARRQHSSLTHTDISVSSFATLQDTSLQTVSLSEGNGITGEGLAGEIVDSVSYDIHQRTVESTDLVLTESGLVDGPIVIENQRAVDASKIQAQAILAGVDESGSSRWSLSGLTGWDEDLAAGESLTLNPIFDETNIDASADTLGRNYRKTVSFRFQDGLRDIASQIVEGTFLGKVGPFSPGAFNIIGSRDRTSEATWFLERKDVLTGSTGSAFVAAGTSLGAEGINLTNDSSNTSLQVGTPTEFQILDSEILSSGVDIEVQFVSLDDIDPDAAYADSDTNGFFSDIVEVNGLGDIFHVLELSYDSELGPADVQWYNEDLDLWVNATLGNSDIEGVSFNPGSTNQGTIIVDGEVLDLFDYLTDTRFEGSYNDYLLSLDGSGPALGAFGSADGRAWAVIDHNSAFSVISAVPEPGSLAFLGAIAGALVLVRRREPGLSMSS